MHFFSKLHTLSIDFIKSLTNFLFPQSPRVLMLEALSTEELLSILPASTLNDEDQTLALFDYGYPLVKEIVWEVKYSGNRVLADRLGEILYDVIMAELEERQIFARFPTVLLMPMPVSDKRRYERGWNQAELLTKALKTRDTGQRFKYLPRQLAKIIHTESQTKTANRSERHENLKDSMRVTNPLSVTGRYVVLIDDVTTTGFTFTEAKRALKESGAKKILCVAVAH